MRTSDKITEITKALIQASKEIKHASKDAKNPHFKNSYASLESVIDASRDILLKNDLIIIQGLAGTNLNTRIQHASGEFIETHMDLVIAKPDMQGLGSAITYGRRYSLAAILNISQADDDAHQAVVSEAPQKSVPNYAPKASPVPQGDKKDFKPNPNRKGLSEAQVKRLYAIGTANGYNMKEVAEIALDRFQCNDYANMAWGDYDSLTTYLNNNRKSSSVVKPTTADIVPDPVPWPNSDEQIPF